MVHNRHSRRFFIGGALALAPLGASAQTANDFLRALTNQGAARLATGGASLSQADIGLGLKGALKVASRKVIGQVGRTDGYFGDPASASRCQARWSALPPPCAASARASCWTTCRCA